MNNNDSSSCSLGRHDGVVPGSESRGSGANPFQGDFGEMWLETVAAACGLLHGRPTTLDFEKADVEVTLLGEVNGTRNPTVKAQVKTTHDLRDHDGETLAYDLDVGTYEVLRQTNHSVPRVLVVVGLYGDENVRLEEDGTLLVGRAAWVSPDARTHWRKCGKFRH